MTQINPRTVCETGIITNVESVAQIQQVGIDVTLKNNLYLPPKSFANVELNEQFNMGDHFAIIIIRSSLSRKGIFLSSGLWDPGYKGPGGVSLYNMSEDTLTLPANFRIGQVVVFKADADSMYNGHYQNNKDITSKLEEVKDNGTI